MIKFALVVLVAATLAINTVESVKFSNKKLNCEGFKLDSSNLKSGSDHTCNKIIEHNRRGISLRIMERFNSIHECLCNLIPIQTIWASMVDDNVDHLYEKITKIVPDDVDEMGFWNKLEESMQHDETPLLERVYVSDAKGLEEAKATCKTLHYRFEPFYDVLKQMVYASGNPNLGFMMSQYDENLFKTLVVYKACV